MSNLPVVGYQAATLNPTWCWAACFSMAMKALLGETKAQCQIVQFVRTSACQKHGGNDTLLLAGTTLGDIAAKCKLSCDAMTSWGLSDLQAAVAAGYLVLMTWTTAEPYGDHLVLVGNDQGGATMVFDPDPTQGPTPLSQALLDAHSPTKAWLLAGL